MIQNCCTVECLAFQTFCRTNVSIQCKAQCLYGCTWISHGDNTFFTIPAGVSVGIALIRCRTDQFRIFQNVIIFLSPLQIFCIDIPFLTFIYHFRAVVQLPECRSSGSHHIQIRFELIICHLVCQIGSCFSIDWIMVVNVCQWELELSFFYKIKISAVTVRKQLIYLSVLSDLNTSDILAVLDPDRICPLQIPWTWVYITGQVKPQIVNAVFLCIGTQRLKQINPCFPGIGKIIHTILSACHMFMICICTWLCRKSIQFPVIYFISILHL